MWRECVRVCVLASVPNVTELFSLAYVFCDVLVYDSECEFVKPQTFPLSRQRDAGDALGCETTTNIEWLSGKSCADQPGTGLHRKVRLSKQCQECLRSRVLLPPEGIRVAWPTSGSACWSVPDGGVRREPSVGCTSTNRTLNKKNGEVSGKQRKTPGEYDLLDLAEYINVLSFADNTWDEEGFCRLVLLEARRGKEVADAARFGEAIRKEKR